MDDLLQALKNAQDAQKEMAEAKKSTDAVVSEIKEQITAKLNEMGLKSAKTDAGSVAIVTKPKIVITNEAKVIAWLNETPNIESDLYMSLNKRTFEPLYKQWFKDTGEIIDGTDTDTSSYLSFKASK